MKKLLTVALILSLVFCGAGCGAAEAKTDESGWSFSYNGTRIEMKADAAPILSALGEPKSYTEETSCAFEGLDKTYYYGSFYMTTYPMDGKDYVYSLWFADDSVATEEGIRIGSTRAEVETVCGAESFDGSNAFVLTRGETKMTIILTDGLVSSVQYEAVFE